MKRLTSYATHTPAEWLLCLLGCALIVSPLVFLPDYFGPFSNAKFLWFIFFVQLALPVFVFVRLSRQTTYSWLRNPILLSLFTLMTMLLMSGLLGVDPFNSFFGNAFRPTGVFFYLHLTLFTLYLVEIFWHEPRWKTLCMDMVIGVATLAALYGLLESWLLPTFVSIEGRAASVFGNPTVFSSFLIIPFFFTLARAADEPRGSTRKLLLACLGIIGGVIFLTGTRSAVVGLLAGALCWSFIKAWKKSISLKQLCLLLGTMLILVVGAFLFVRATIPPEHPLYRLTDFSDVNTQARLTYWSLGLRGWMENPFLGVGSENFYSIADEYGDPSVSTFTSYWPDKTHSALVGRLMATGLVGMGAYLVLLFFVIRTLWRSPLQSHHIWIAGLMAYLIHGLFLFETVSGLMMVFFLMAMTASLDIQPSSRKSSRSPHLKPMLTGVSIMASALLIFLITVPMHQFLLRMGEGNGRVENDPTGAIALYESTEKLPFLWDTRLLAKAYFTLLTHSLVTENLPKTSLDALFERTRGAFEQTLERHPKRAQDWNDFARLFLLLAIFHEESVSEEGYTAVEQARSLAPFNPIPLETLTSMLLQDVEYFASQGEYETVIMLYQQLIELNPNEFSYLANLAAAYVQAGQIEKARETALKLREQDPASVASVEAFLESL